MRRLSVLHLDCDFIAICLALEFIALAGCEGTSLTNPERSPTWSLYPQDYFPEKQASEVGQELTRIATQTFQPPWATPGRYTPLPARTPEPFVTGIFGGGQIAPVSPPYGMSNLWAGIVNGEETLVIAGIRHFPEEAQETSQGVVMVEVHSIDHTNGDFAIYDAPIADTGLLKITVVEGYRLTIQAESGAVLYFDVPTRRFVDSLAATVSAPTVTPLPPVTPTPTEIPFIPCGEPYPPYCDTPTAAYPPPGPLPE
jgi:hypothetical protein